MIRFAGLIVLLAVALSARVAVADATRDAYDRSVRELDGEVFLEDEPIWLCSGDLGGRASTAAFAFSYRLVGTDGYGRSVASPFSGPPPGYEGQVPRAAEFGSSFNFTQANGRFPLFGDVGAIPAGVWQVRGTNGDTARVLARFRVVPPAGSERSVRDALARAARLTAQSDAANVSAEAGGPARAAALYDAVYRRYPRTTYLSMIYWGQWTVQAHTRFAHDPGRWLEEIFAHFHDSCFGTIALDRWVRDMGEDAARPTIRRLVGLYPDTPLSRAAARYL